MGMPSFGSMQALPGIAPMQTNIMQSNMMQSNMMQSGYMDPMSMMMTNQFGGFRQ